MLTQKQVVILILTIVGVLALGQASWNFYQGYKELERKAAMVDGLQTQINYIGSSYCRFVEVATQGSVKCEVKDGQVSLP